MTWMSAQEIAVHRTWLWGANFHVAAGARTDARAAWRAALRTLNACRRVAGIVVPVVAVGAMRKDGITSDDDVASSRVGRFLTGQLPDQARPNLYYKLRRRNDTLWLYAQFLWNDPVTPDLDCLRARALEATENDAYLGGAEIVSILHPEPAAATVLFADGMEWAGRSDTKSAARIRLGWHAGDLALVYDREDDPVFPALLLDHLPAIQRSALMRRYAFDREYAPKLRPRMAADADALERAIEATQASGRITAADIDRLDPAAAALNDACAALRIACADARVADGTIAVNAANFERAATLIPADLAKALEAEREAFAHAHTQIDADVSIHGQIAAKGDAAFRALVLRTDMLRARLQDRETRAATAHTTTLAAIAVVLAAAQLMTDDVVKDAARNLGAKEWSPFALFAAKLVPLGALASLVYALRGLWHRYRKGKDLL